MEDIILSSLYDSGYTEEDILDYGKDYYITYNPLTSDTTTRSCMIFKETGVLKMLNGSVTIEGKEYTTLTITTWLRYLDCGLRHYISGCLFDLNIRKIDYLDYVEYAENRLLKLNKFNKKFEEIRKKLYSKYILDVDVIRISNTTTVTKKKPKPPKVQSATMCVEQADEIEREYLLEYLETRGIPSTNIGLDCIVYNTIYRKPALSFRYNNGFTKYRIAFESDKTRRFRSVGKYEDFFHVRIEGSKRIWVVEGEIEAITLSLYVEDDIVAMHNTNSLPSNLSLLDNYEEVLVRIDLDRFEENKKIFSNYLCSPKTSIEGEDYNSLHVKGLLKDIIGG